MLSPTDIDTAMAVYLHLFLFLSMLIHLFLSQTFSSFFNSLHFRATAMEECINWMAELAMPDGPTGLNRSGGDSATALQGDVRWRAPPEMVKQWLLAFPKLLWKLKAQNLDSSQVLFLTLRVNLPLISLC